MDPMLDTLRNPPTKDSENRMTASHGTTRGEAEAARHRGRESGSDTSPDARIGGSATTQNLLDVSLDRILVTCVHWHEYVNLCENHLVFG